MSPEVIGAIIGAIIGAFLATISGVYLNYRQGKSHRENQKELFILIIKDDLNNSISLYDQIKEIGKNQKFISFEAVNELRYSRKIYEKYIENVVFIHPHSLRNEIFDYYIKSSAFIDKLENFQKMIYNHQESIRNYEFSFKLNMLDKKNLEKESKIIEELTQEFNQKIAFLLNVIQAEVSNLENFKIEAKFILQKLSSLKK